MIEDAIHRTTAPSTQPYTSSDKCADCKTTDPFPTQYVRCHSQWRKDVTRQVNATHQRASSEQIAPCAYPLRPKRTGREVKAFPKTADSLQASPLLRLATWSSNTSSLRRHPSSPASTHRVPLQRLPPPLWGDPSAHSSNREPSPVDKLLKFRS